VPSVSAALPCNRRRREMLLKSIDYSPWRVNPRSHLAAAPVRRSLKCFSQSSCQSLSRRICLF
jgi:hypothetical protein